MAPASPKRSLTCACCGGEAGKWQQFWNQDNGYGICRSCVDAQIEGRLGRPSSVSYIETTYGKPGVNYAPTTKTYEVFVFPMHEETPNNYVVCDPPDADIWDVLSLVRNGETGEGLEMLDETFPSRDDAASAATAEAERLGVEFEIVNE